MTQENIEFTLSKDSIHTLVRDDLRKSNIDISEYTPDIVQYDSTLDAEETVAIMFTTLIRNYNKKMPFYLLGMELGEQLTSSDTPTATQLGMDILMLYVDDNIFNLYDPKTVGSLHMAKPLVKASNYTISQVALAQYLPPMIQQPDSWYKDTLGGFVSNKKKPILGSKFNSETDFNYSAINKLQSISWSLVPEMLKHQTFTVRKGYSEQPTTEFSQKLMLQTGNTFHFPYRADYRGRLYSQGHYINVQGDEQKKAMLQFTKQEPLTERGMHWLGIEIANRYGLDKKTFQQRSQWFNRNKASLIANPERWIKKAEEPLLFRKALLALTAPSTGLNMALDATNSVLQVYSVLYSCKETAELCNVAGKDRVDAYGVLAKKMNELLSVDFITRKSVKKAFMVFFYNAGEKTVAKNLQSELGSNYSQAVLEAFYTEIEALAPAGMEGKQDIQESYRVEDTEHSWSLPNKFKVSMKTIGYSESTVQSEDIKVDVRYPSIKTNPYNRALAPSVVHSIDAYLVDQMVLRCPFQVATIHDEFQCHPNNCDALIATYKEILCELNDSTLLADILSEIDGCDVRIEKTNTLSNSDILKAIHPLS